jgi:glycosyltransferase involved in cell wall biosynthesis
MAIGGAQTAPSFRRVQSMGLPQVRLISRENGVGLSRDLDLMAGLLAGQARVERLGIGGRSRMRLQELGLWGRRLLHGKAPLQLFAERVYRRCLPLAERNLLVPNPEWFLERWLPLLPAFDAVLCKTRHAERIFHALGCDARYIGFTSPDRMQAAVPRQRVFLHLAGRSSAKGTQALLATWQRHPHWPLLVVVQHPKIATAKVVAANIDHRIAYLDDAALQALQNQCLFHVCPSETEGFGHYLMEGLSVGAVVLTTDAEPMAELVAAQRGIHIPVAGSRTDGLARRYFVDGEGIAAAVEQALALDAAALARLSHAARSYYLCNDRAFARRFQREVLAWTRSAAALPLAEVER